jgi:hypothetical protein
VGLAEVKPVNGVVPGAEHPPLVEHERYWSEVKAGPSQTKPAGTVSHAVAAGFVIVLLLLIVITYSTGDRIPVFAVVMAPGQV